MERSPGETVTPRSHEGLSFLGWTTAILPGHGNQFPARWRIAASLHADGSHNGQTVFARTGPLTWLVATIGAGHRDVDKEKPACERVAGSDIQPGLLK